MTQTKTQERNFLIGQLAFEVFAIVHEDPANAYAAAIQKKIATERKDGSWTPNALDVGDALRVLEKMGLVALTNNSPTNTKSRIKSYHLTAIAGFYTGVLGW